jgi:PAS domain S-box-containing protein
MAESISVLHVEDDPAFGEMVAEFLHRADESISVTTITDPESALTQVRADPAAIDCIVSDYDMPELDGVELLRTVREEWPELPFILFTGKGSEEVAAEAISAGVTDYLQKNTGTETYEILAHRIQNAVERTRARQEASRIRRFLEKVVERATDMIAVVDSTGEIVFVSGSVEHILGYTPEELKALGPFELVHPDDRDRIEEHFRKRLDDPERPTGITHRVRDKRGHDVQVEARAYNLTDDSDIEGILIYTRESDGKETS